LDLGRVGHIMPRWGAPAIPPADATLRICPKPDWHLEVIDRNAKDRTQSRDMPSGATCVTANWDMPNRISYGLRDILKHSYRGSS